MRFGAAIVGPAGMGKSTIRRVLAAAMTDLSERDFARKKGLPLHKVRQLDFGYRISGLGAGGSVASGGRSGMGSHARSSSSIVPYGVAQQAGGGAGGEQPNRIQVSTSPMFGGAYRAASSNAGAEGGLGASSSKGSLHSAGRSSHGLSHGASSRRIILDAKKEREEYPSRIVLHELNPKSVTLQELYGTFNDVSQEWSDGVASALLRGAAKDPGPDRHWIVFDGPVDAVWIESLNTVLDDNQMLCLANGERVRLKPHMRVLFEVGDLQHASPATVSRLGVVFVAETDLGWEPLVGSWLGGDFARAFLPKACRVRLQYVLLGTLPALFKFVESEAEVPIKSGRTAAVVSCLALLQSCIADIEKDGVRWDKDLTQAVRLMDRLATFAATWAVGGQLAEEHWRGFDKAMRDGLRRAGIEAGLPSAGMCFDFFVRVEEGLEAGLFRPWRDVVPQVNPSNDPAVLSTLIVPTSDTVRFGRLTQLLSFGPAFLETHTKGMAPIHDRVGLPVGWVAGGAAGAGAGGSGGSSSPKKKPTTPKTPSASASGVGGRGTALERAAAATVEDGWDYKFPEDGAVFLASRPVFMTGTTGTGKSVLLSKIVELTAQQLEDEDGGSHAQSGAGTPRASGREGREDGDGKDAHRQALLAGVGAEYVSAQRTHPVSLVMSARTSSTIVQESIEMRLVRRGQGSLTPPSGTRAVIFVDDVNMPAKEEYGAQPPIELLRQLLDSGGWYDRSKLHWSKVSDFAMLAAGAPPSGGRQTLDERFSRHMTVLNMPAPSDEAMRLIFGTILTSFFAGFPTEVRALGSTIVSSTIAVYRRVTAEMKPTPSKAHYMFNLRDVAGVFKGILMGQPEKCGTGPVQARLWMHECMRLFHDRLASEKDRTWFTTTLVQTLHRYFRLPWTWEDLFGPEALGVLGDQPGAGDGGSEVEPRSMGDGASIAATSVSGMSSVQLPHGKGRPGETQRATIGPLVFGSFFTPGEDESQMKYEECPDPSRLGRLLDAYLQDHNLDYPRSPMQLVFFRGAIEHVVRLCRVLSQPRGHAMLVGVAGSGKQSLARLAAYIARCEVVQGEGGVPYTVETFRESLKTAMLKAGVEKQKTVMLLPDAMVGEEALFEDVNCVLNQGEVPGLWEQDELEMIYGRMGQVLADEQQLLEEKVQAEEEAAAAAGKVDDIGDDEDDEDEEDAFAKAAARNDLYATFVERLRANLHMLLATSPVGATLRRRLRTFPSLLSCCSIDWFEQWPRAALSSVGTRLLRLVCLPSTIPAPHIPGAQPEAQSRDAGKGELAAGLGAGSAAATGLDMGSSEMLDDDEYTLQRPELLPPFA